MAVDYVRMNKEEITVPSRAYMRDEKCVRNFNWTKYGCSNLVRQKCIRF
jgi:hypothetical protein